MAWFAYLACRGWRSGLYWRQNFPHLAAWKLVGSICTTDSASGREKLHQKAMAKVYSYLTVKHWYCQSASLHHVVQLTSAWLLCLHNCMAATLGGVFTACVLFNHGVLRELCMPASWEASAPVVLFLTLGTKVYGSRFVVQFILFKKCRAFQLRKDCFVAELTAWSHTRKYKWLWVRASLLVTLSVLTAFAKVQTSESRQSIVLKFFCFAKQILQMWSTQSTPWVAEAVLLA